MANAVLRIELLGGLRVWRTPDASVAIPARKAQALLAYLGLTQGRAHSRDRLAALLWEDSASPQARASLRQALAVLRQALGTAAEAAVMAEGDTVALTTSVVVDACEFDRLVDDPKPSDADERAGALYRGDLLEAFHVRSSGFESWLAGERQRLRERAIQVFSRLLARHARAGALDRAIDQALRLVALDPLQEAVHRTLMELYARQGREAAALRQYRVCREMLARELRVNPEPETERLVAAIREQRRRAPPDSKERTTAVRRGAEDSEDPPEAEPSGSSGASSDVLRARSAPALRPVTVLAIEQDEGFLTAADPEAAQVAAAGVARGVLDVVSTFDGLVYRELAGTSIVVFGAHTAHTDDMERAVRCAFTLQRLGNEPAEGATLAGVRRAGMGLASGTALVTPMGQGEGGILNLTGPVVNLAIRLAGSACSGEILVTESLLHELSPRLEGDGPPRIILRGSEGDVSAWPVRTLRARALWASPPFVGRRVELAQFGAALQACIDTARGTTVYVRGEPGIGKSRLVQEFADVALGRGFSCHTGTVLDFGAAREHAPIVTIARTLLGSVAGRVDATAEEAIAAAIEARVFEADRRMYLHDLLQVPQLPALQAMFDALDTPTRNRERSDTLAQLVRAASKRRPALVVLEDLHWADPTTLALAAAVATATADVPALLVVTSRLAASEVDHLLQRAGPGCMTIDLAGLRLDEARTLAASLTPASDAFVERCVARSGGNPLFLEHLLRGAHADPAQLPASVQSVVVARVDALGAADARALRVASVLGQRFTCATLRHLLDDDRYDPRALITQGLLRPDGEELRFAHALVQDGVYSSVTRAERRRLHENAAAWLADQDPSLRAEHLDRAEHPDAARAYLVAAQAESNMHRTDRALALADRAQVLASDQAAKFAAALGRGHLLLDLGRVREATDAFDLAWQGASDDGDRCRALIGLASAKRIADDLVGARRDVGQAIAIATRDSLTADAARAHGLLGNLLFPLGDFDGCLREHRRSLELAQEASSPELEAAALGGLGDAEYMRGHMMTAQDRFRACVDLARRHGFRRIEAANLPMAAITRWFAGALGQATDEALQSISLAARIGHRRAEAIGHHVAYFCHLARCETAIAWGHAQKALALARELGASRFEAEALGMRGELHRLSGRRDDALTDIQQALAISRVTGMSYLGPYFLALLSLATREATVRAAALAEGEALLEAGAVGHNHLLYRKYAIEACIDSRDPGAVRRHAEALEAFARPEPTPWTDFVVARARAIAAAAPGRRDGDVVPQLEQVARQALEAGMTEALPAIEEALGRTRARRFSS